MQDQPQDFEPLRQLLAFKRHEAPPPGYFQGFSRQVILRIESGTAAQADGWLARVLVLFQTRPAISWSFCMATGLVVIAAGTSFVGDPTSNAGESPAANAMASMAEQPVSAPATGAFLVTNLEPREFALEMAPPRLAATPTNNSLFSTPFYLRPEAQLDFRTAPIPASFEVTKP